VLSFELREVRDALTTATIDKEQFEANYNDVYLSHTNYKDKSVKDIAALNKMVADLQEQLKKALAEIADLKIKVPSNPVDPVVLEKVQKQLKALQDENTKIRRENTQEKISSRESIGGRRAGVVVKDGRDAGKKRTEKKDKSGVVGVVSEGEIEEESKKKPPRALKRLKSGKKNEEEEETEDGEEEDDDEEEEEEEDKGDKKSPKKPVKRKLIKKVSDIGDDEEDEGVEETVKSGKGAVKYKPVQRAHGKTTSSANVSETASVKNSVVASAKKSSKGSEEEVTEGGELPPQGDAAVVEVVEGDGSAVDSSVLTRSPEGEVNIDGSVSAEEGSETGSTLGAPSTQDKVDDGVRFAPSLSIVRTMSNKRITRLASGEPENPKKLLKKASSILLEDDELLDEAGCNNDFMRTTFLQSFSDDEDSEGGSLSDESESEDEFDLEVSMDVAKTWGSFTKSLNDVLTDNLSEKEANHITHVIAPITIEFSSLLVKSTIVSVQALHEYS
jgi:hypothetical protein